jgi:hypothetical protein
MVGARPLTVTGEGNALREQNCHEAALPEPERMARLRLVTAFYERLQRQVRLLVACLMLALAAAPSSDVAPRDASAVSIAAGSLAAHRSTAQRAPALQNVTQAPAQTSLAAATAAAGTESPASHAPHTDRRYLYLELLALLC